jgi:hypothetical protein
MVNAGAQVRPMGGRPWRDWSLVLIFTLFALGCAREATVFRGQGFTIEVPDGIRAEARSPVEDFTLYRFLNRSDRVVLGIYAGNHPSLRRADFIRSATPTQLNGLSAKRVSWISGRDLRSVELLVDLNQALPMFLHVEYLELTADEAIMAEVMISSIQKSTR